MGSASKTPHMQGGFASLFDATPAQCVKVPRHVAYQAAALAEPLAVSLHAVSRAGDDARQEVILFGAGPIGLLTMLAARLKGCGELTVADIAEAPLAFAGKLGADRTIDLSGGDAELKALAAEKPLDVAFEISGTAAGLAAAIASVRRGGTVVQVGNLPGGQIPAPANAVMATLMREAFRHADVAWHGCHLRDSGDGMLIVIPPDIPTAKVMTALTWLATGLKRYNQRAARGVRIQLRTAVHIGPVATGETGLTGEALILVARLLDAPVLKRSMAETGALLGVIASVYAYESVIRHLDVDGYSQVRCKVKESRLIAWMFLSGQALLPGS